MAPDPVPDLNQTIVAAVNARVEAEMVKALSGDDVIGQFVASAMQEMVPASNASYERQKVTYMHKLLKDTIQAAAKDAVQRFVEEEMDRIHEEVRKALKRNITQIADALATNLSQSVSKGYGIKVDLTLNVPRNYG